MSKLILLKDEFEVKKILCDLLSEVTFGQAEAIGYALDMMEEYEFTKNYIHENGLEFDLLSKYNHCKSKGGNPHSVL